MKDHGAWRKARNPFLEGNKTDGCYIDGRFVPPFMCDYVQCVKIDSTLGVALIEYAEDGTTKAPREYGVDTSKPFQKYRTVPLHGELKIEFRYYLDSKCSDEQVFSEVIFR